MNLKMRKKTMTNMIGKIRDDMITARKGDDPVAKSLLVTLYSEASRVGKDKRNGDPTDEEVVAVVKKFAANAEEDYIDGVPAVVL